MTKRLCSFLASSSGYCNVFITIGKQAVVEWLVIVSVCGGGLFLQNIKKLGTAML